MASQVKLVQTDIKDKKHMTLLTNVAKHAFSTLIE
jgi:hypothetical protein